MRPQDVWNAIAEGRRLKAQDPDMINEEAAMNGLLDPGVMARSAKGGSMPGPSPTPAPTRKPTPSLMGPPAPLAPAPAAAKPPVLPSPARIANLNENSTKAVDNSTRTFNDQKVLGQKEWDQAREYLEQQAPSGMNEQRRSIEEMNDATNRYAEMPLQADLSPLMALTDAWTGSKLSGAYKAPERGDERLANMAKLKDAIAKQRGQFTGDQINLLRSLTGGFERNIVGNTVTDTSGTQGAFVPKAGGGGGGAGNTALLKEMRANLDKNVTQVKNIRTEQFGSIDGALASRDYQRVAQTLAQFARTISGEKGVLTEGDLQRIIPKNWNTTASKFLSYFSDNANTKVDPAYVSVLRQAVKEARKNSAKLYVELLETKESMYKADPRYDANAQRTVDAVRSTLNDYSKSVAPEIPPGTTKVFKGKEFQFKGGENKQENWIPTGK